MTYTLRPDRRRRRWLAPLAALAALTLIATACGNGDFGGDAPEDPAAEPDADTDPDAEEAPDDSEPPLSDPPPIEGDVITEDLGEHTLNFGIGLAANSPQGLSVQYFGDILEERTEGRVTVELFPDSSIGDDSEMMSALQSGTLAMTFPSTSPATSAVSELAVFDLPFLMPDVEAADRVLDSDLGQELLDEFEGTGMTALVWAENGFRQLTNSQRPVETPDDVAGLNLRVMENPIQVSIWNALGANPQAMAFGEVFSALEQGVVDGQENPWVTNYTSNFGEVQAYGSETRHVYTPFVMLIGEDLYNGLDPAYQELIQEAAEDTRDYQRVLSREMDEWAREQFGELAEVNVLDEEQLDAFREATEPVYDEWAPQIGEDLVEEVRSMAQDG
jgi:TRAP-type transport system periplasmic protein